MSSLSIGVGKDVGRDGLSTILGERCQEGGRIEGTVAGARLANAGYCVGKEGGLTGFATET